MSTNNIKQLIHTWAQNRSESRKCGNVSFIGPKLYSYAMVIGLLIPEHNIALVSSNARSVTTSKHCSYARYSISNDYTTISTNLDLNRYYLLSEFKNTLIAEQLELLQHHLDQSCRATKRALSNLELAYDIYCNIHRLVEIEPVATIQSSDLALCLNNFIGSQIEFPEFRIVISEKLFPQIKLALEKQAKAQREKRKKEIEEAKNQLIKWRNFEFNGSIRCLDPVIRINNDVIETSHGASVPLEEALILLPLLNTPETLRYRTIGHFQIRSIDSEYITIGCHKIPLAELEQLKPLLKVTK